MATLGTHSEAITTPVEAQAYATTTGKSAYTSLIPNPPTAPATSTPDSRAPSPEPWDQYKASHAHDKRVQREIALQSCTRALANHMLDGLVLSESERLRLFATVYAALYEEVSTTNLLASLEAIS